MEQTNSSPLDARDVSDFIRELVAKGETNASIAVEVFEEFNIPTSRDSIRRFRARHNLEIPTVKTELVIDGDDAVINTPPSTNPKHMDDPDAMLRERGLDPEQWVIQGVTVNEWDGPVKGGSIVTYHQCKLQLKRKLNSESILPARAESAWKNQSVVAGEALGTSTEKVVIVGDQQAPFHDKELHAKFLEWLRVNQPDQGILLGDTIDLPNVSRHRDDPAHAASVNECVQSGYELLKDYVEASPNTKWQKLYGNHDERLRNYVIDNASKLYGVKRAEIEGSKDESVLDVSYLMRLDELGIQVCTNDGPYNQGQIVLGNAKLAVRHGWITKNSAGSSAMASLDKLGYSIVVGHTHRQGLVHKTHHDIDGTTATLVGVESGCMCAIVNPNDGRRGFPTFTVSPDWQQGFAVANVHPDGTFKVDLATFVNHRLLYRDESY